MPTVVVTAALQPHGPVSLDEAKAWMRVDTDDEDALIDSLLTEATEAAQLLTSRQFLTATFDAKYDSLPPMFLLPYGQLQSVTSVKYLDTDGVEQTLAADQYRVDIVSEPGRITPAYQATWPTVRIVTGTVTVRFVCGYGNASKVPEKIKAAIKVYAAAKYLCREGGSDMDAFHALLSEYRLWGADL